MNNSKKIINYMVICIFYFSITLTLQSCLPTAIPKILKFAGRESSKQTYEEERKSTQSAIELEITQGEIIDFSSVKPYARTDIGVSVDYDPFAYPYCDEVYENVPEGQRPKEICEFIPNGDTCEMYEIWETENNAFEYFVFRHDKGYAVFLVSNLLDYLLNVNGKCRLRTD